MLEMNRTDKPARSTQNKDSNGTALTGTFVSVMLLGAFLVLTWVTVFILFLVRN